MSAKLRSRRPSHETVVTYLARFGLALVGMLAAAVLIAPGAAANHPGHTQDRLGPAAYQDLQRGTALCPKAFEVVGTRLCTHGPDPDPEPDELLPTPSSVEGATPSAVEHCLADPTSGKRVQVIYAAPAGVTNRYDTVLPTIRAHAAAADTIYFESARQTGEARRIRFVTDSSCEIDVDNVTFNSFDDDDSFSKEIQELQRQGFDNSQRLYMIFLDKNVSGCGIGNISSDSQPGRANVHNTGPRYGRTDLGCWGGGTPAHELMHNLGGVQLDAPSSTGWDGNNGYHCWDEYDRMCYNDGATYFDNGGTLQFLCTPQSAFDNRFDCNDDDYYSTGSPTGYLGSNWNTASNQFLRNNGFGAQNGDFNGDGRDDIAYFTRGSSGDVYVSLSTGSSFGTPTKWHDSFSFGSEVPLVGDFNGDGKFDIATFTRGTSADVYVALSNGSSFVGTAVRWHASFAFGDEIPAVGDVTCDGKDDIVTFKRDTFGDVYVAKSTGSSFSGGGVLWHGNFANGNDIPAVGDFNGGGCDDIAVFKRGHIADPGRGDVYVALSNGSDRFGPDKVAKSKWHDFFGINFETLTVGDFNGDSKDDIVTFNRGTFGDVYVAKSTGSNFSGGTSVWHSAFAFGTDVPGVGRFNSGVREDIVTFQRGSTTNSVYVGLANGSGSAFLTKTLWRSSFGPPTAIPQPANVW